MKVLVIGGTGTISLSVVRRLVKKGAEVWTLSRGGRNNELPEGVNTIICDAYDEEAVKKVLEGKSFDAICDWICYTREDALRDIRTYAGHTKQFIFTSSASAYHKPVENYIITEGTTLANPHWEYSRNKIAAEEAFFTAFREQGFPITVVRPSHTYFERSLPVSIHGHNGSWSVIKRMLEGKKILVPGDGTSLWTLTWAEDFAVGYTGLVGNRKAIGEAFHITGDEVLTWNTILGTAASILGVEYKPCYVPSDLLGRVGKKYGYDFEGGLLGDKAHSVVFDNSKLKRLVPEMTTRTIFCEGAEKAINYILSHSECQREDKEFDAFCDKVIAAMEKAEEEL